MQLGEDEGSMDVAWFLTELSEMYENTNKILQFILKKSLTKAVKGGIIIERV